MPDTIGQQLKRARLDKNLTIDDAVQATRIRAHYIKALEADDFESLPSAAQSRGFLKIYCIFLGLSLDDLLVHQRDTSSILKRIPESTVPTASELNQSDSISEPETKLVIPEIEQRNRTKSGKKKRKVHEQETPPSQAVTQPEIEQGLSEEPGGTGEITGSPAALLSYTLFSDIGISLRQRREALSLSLEEIERHIHVRKHFLEALETGEYDLLPSSVHARGMLQNYAVFLGLDGESLLLKFADGLQAQLNERHRRDDNQVVPQKGKKTLFPASLRRYLSPDILIGGGLVITLALFAIWGTGRVLNMSGSFTPQPTAPSISDILISSPAAGIPSLTPTQSVGSTTVIPDGTLAAEIATLPAQTGMVQVVLVTYRNAWVKVIVDGKVEYEGRTVPGTAYVYDADNQIEVITGDGGAVNIIYNQSNLGTMGAYGEVVDRIYTRTTILMPTATFTPSPTITPTPTVTPRPSATPRPTATLRPSATPKP